MSSNPQAECVEANISSSQHFDVVISGGGLAGCLMALSLAAIQGGSRPLTIAIIEENLIAQGVSQSFDDRVLALAHGSAGYLNQLGLWSSVKPYAQPIETIHISDRGHYGKARLQAKDYRVSALGYVVPMSSLGQALRTALASKNIAANITWFSPDRIKNVAWQAQQVVLALASNKQISASLLLGCDGVNSVCRTAANIASHAFDYQQTAIIANIEVSKAHNNVAFERFTEQGPIAVLPLASTNSKAKCSLVWTLTPAQASKVQQYSDEDFKQAITDAFGYWLGQVSWVGKRHAYPLKLLQADAQIYHRMALIGNASHTLHPIAGQGFNLGVRDVEQLATLLCAYLKNNSATHNDALDLGDYALLREYALQRGHDHQQIIGLTDSLVTLFSNQFTPLVAGRNLALTALNNCSPFKRTLANKTMGY